MGQLKRVNAATMKGVPTFPKKEVFVSGMAQSVNLAA